MDYTVHGILQARILFPSPRDLPNPGMEPRFPTLWADSLPAEPPGQPKNSGVGTRPFSGSSQPRSQTGVSCIVGGFFTSWATREACTWQHLGQMPVRALICRNQHAEYNMYPNVIYASWSYLSWLPPPHSAYKCTCILIYNISLILDKLSLYPSLFLYKIKPDFNKSCFTTS